MFGGFPLGSVVVFRYGSPTAHDPRPTVFVLAQNYRGLLHGLNIRYLSPIVQQQLQWYFIPPAQQQQQMDPFQQQLTDYQKKLAEYQKKKQEIFQKQNSVIVKPADNGSPFGVSTFGRTQQQQIPATQVLPPNQQQQPEPVEPEAPKVVVPPATTSQFHPQSGQRQIPTNPFQFYYQVVKPLLGADVEKVYRTYKPLYIMNTRVIKSVRRF